MTQVGWRKLAFVSAPWGSSFITALDKTYRINSAGLVSITDNAATIRANPLGIITETAVTLTLTLPLTQ